MTEETVSQHDGGGPDAVPAGCPWCGEATEPGDRFCEACGHATGAPSEVAEAAGAPSEPGVPDVPAVDAADLGAADPVVVERAGVAGVAGAAEGESDPDVPGGAGDAVPGLVACVACGEGSVDADGYCDACGRPAPAAGDHVELGLHTPAEPAPAAAGVSDRGHHRRRNEDSFALGRCHTADGRPAVVAVVADGVASVPDGDAASRAAGTAAVAAGTGALTDGEEPAYAAAVAAEAARMAVSALAPDEGRPPACTYVAALVVDDVAIVSWVGDSRAYWLAPGDPQLLTEDDSWATEMVAAGLADAATAHLDPRAHVITRWLAADAPEVTARSVQVDLDGSGVLLLCSDGVWNHLPDPWTLQDVLAGAPEAAGDPMLGARALVQAALDDGGTDNATAVLVAAAPGSGAQGGGAGPGTDDEGSR